MKTSITLLCILHSYTLYSHSLHMQSVEHGFVLINGDSYNYNRLETTSEIILFNYIMLYGFSKNLLFKSFKIKTLSYGSII